MDSPKFYKAQGWSKKTLRTSSFLHAWRVSKRTMRTSATFLHAWWRFNLTLPTATSLLHAWRYSKRTLQTPTCLGAVKTDSPNFYKPPTRLAVVKTDYLNFLTSQLTQYFWLIHLKVVKKNKIRTWMFTSLLHTWWQRSKQTSQTFTSLLNAWRWLKGTLQASFGWVQTASLKS